MTKVKVLARQTIMDIAIQYTGSAANAFAIAQKNNLSITGTLTTGQIVVIPAQTELDWQQKAVEFFAAQNIQPGTISIYVNPITIIDYILPQEFPLR